MAQQWSMFWYVSPHLPLHISRAFCWFHIFPRFRLVTHFPVLCISCMLSPVCSWLNVFLSSVTEFSHVRSGFMRFFLLLFFFCFYVQRYSFLRKLIYPANTSVYVTAKNLTTRLLQFVQFCTVRVMVNIILGCWQPVFSPRFSRVFIGESLLDSVERKTRLRVV